MTATGWQLDGKSYTELYGVHEVLVKCVALAVIYCPTQRFAVHDGLRTEAEQAEYVRTGVSTTLNSKHLKQADGFGHAADLVPLINGKLRWEWPPIFVIAAAMHKAATEKCIKLTWGAVWDRELTSLNPFQLENESRLYAQRKLAADKKAGRKPRVFLDGPHFQLAG
jgi:peptidoglycan L-alanyl-D-glutamate endopeptidase CwlK